jgi:hypothetical protein
MSTTHKSEITPFEYARLGGYMSLRPIYEQIWLGQVVARKVRGRWRIDAQSAAQKLKALNRSPVHTSRRDQAASVEESLHPAQADTGVN